MNLNRYTIMLALFCFFTLSLSAQNNNYHEMSLEELMNVDITTASSVKEKLTESPSTVYVITSEDIESRGYMSLIDVLEDIPEVEIQDKNQSEIYNYITIRGIPGQEHFVILQDGARINSMAATRHAIDVNYNIKNAERIEIVMGPASAVYGADAFSGVINIITKKGDAIKGVSVTGSFGRFNTTQNAISLGYGKNNVSVALHGSYFRSDEPFMPKYYTDSVDGYGWYTNHYAVDGSMGGFGNSIVPLSAQEEKVIEDWGTPKIGYSFSGTLKIKDLEFGGGRNSIQYSSNSGTNPKYGIYSPDHHWQYSITNFFMKYHWTSDNEKFSIDPQISATLYQVDPMSKFVNVYSSYFSAYKYAFNTGYQASLNLNYSPNEQNRISGGPLFRQIEALPKTSDMVKPFEIGTAASTQGLYYIGTEVNDTTGRSLAIPQNFYYYSEQTLGGFAQYQTNLQNVLFLTLGTRVDYNTRYGLEVNPRIGLVIRPIESLRFRLSYNEAFIAPSPEKTYEHFGSFYLVDSTNSLNSGFFHLPNADLKPAKLRAGELSISYLKGDFGVSVGGYFNAISNLPVPTLVFDTTFVGQHVDVAEVNKNVGSSNAYGGTVKLDYKHKFGTNTQLSAYAIYSLSLGTTGDDDLELSAPHTVKAGLTFKWKGLTIDPRVIYRSGTATDVTDANNEHIITPSFALVNLYLAYRVLKPGTASEGGHSTFDIFLRVRNLLDARYYNATTGTAFDHFANSPQDPMRFTAGMTYTFSKAKR